MRHRQLSKQSNGHHSNHTLLSEESMSEGHWLRLTRIKYLDPAGVEREWEAVSRLVRPARKESDGVSVIAIYRRMLHYDVVVFVRQFRPSLNKYTIEFPHGLLEPSESVEECAVRKLLEETGWHGEVNHSGAVLAADPSCSSVTLKYATLKVNGDSLENLNPIAIPAEQDQQHMDLIMIPLSEVHERLEELANQGNMIDAKVAIWSIGIQMGLKVAKDAEQDAHSVSQASLPTDSGSVRSGM